MIDSCAHGTLIKLGAGVHRWNSPPDFSAKSAIRVEGSGGTGYNEDENWGTIIKPNYTGPCFVDTGIGVKHAGTTFQWLNLRPDRPDSIGWRFRAVNHVMIRDCSAKGPFSVVIDGDVPISQYPSGDHAYNKAENLWVVNTQPNARGFVLGDGFWWLNDCNWDLTGPSPVAITNLRGNLSIRGGKANHAGTHLYSSGNSVDVVGMHCEQAPYTGAFILVVERGQNTLPGAGCYHKFIACTFTPHSDAYQDGAKIVRFGPGTFGNNFPRAFNNTAYDRAGSFVNEGADGTRVFEPL